MGKLFVNVGGGGADTDVVTAGASDVLAGKVIVGPDGEPLTGTMAGPYCATQARNSGKNEKGVYYYIDPGYYQDDGYGGSWVYRPLSDFGSASTAQVLSGATFTSTAGKTVSGTIPYLNGGTYTPTTAAQTIGCAGYYMNHNITIAAIPSSYVSIAGGITFFKDGAFGQIVTNLGIGKYRPYSWGAKDDEGWYTISSWQGDKSSLTLKKAGSGVTAGFAPSATSCGAYNCWCTRKTINFDNIKQLVLDVVSGGSSDKMRWWFWNVDKQKCKHFDINGLDNTLNLSSVTGNCVFGALCRDGSGYGCTYGSIIFY